MQGLTHIDANGNAVMVDVGEKSATRREAVAKGKIKMNMQAYQALVSGCVKKGDVLGTARIAGIMAVKRTADLIPLCHPLPITKCAVDFVLIEARQEVETTCTVSLMGVTGVEMEALTGASVALLTIYDMCKALDKGMVVSDIRLVRKSGGKSGDYLPQEELWPEETL